MGDVKGREPRRSSLIVTSTPTTSRQEEQESTNPDSLKEEADDQPLPSPSVQDHSNKEALARSDKMYGPALAVYPQWQQFQQPHSLVPHQTHSRFGQTSYHHPQTTFNMQALQRTLPSQQQASQYPTGSPPQSIPFASSQSQSHGQFYNIPSFQTTTYYDPYGHAYNSPPPPSSAPPQQLQQPQQFHSSQGQGYAMAPYSSSYPPQSQSTVATHSPSFGHWGPHSQMAPYYYMPQYQGPVSPHQVQFQSQQPMNAPYGPRRQSIPHARYGDHEGYQSTDQDPMHLGTYRPGSSPRGQVGRIKRQSPTSLGKPGSPTIGSGINSSFGPSSIGVSALHPSLPRGPPRKPRQSGHALWVGNLPPGTNVVALKDYFATPDIESVFLISKSNCAFVNYRSEAACNAAMEKFHDSRFQGVRLVCRLRRNSSPGTALPTSPINQGTNIELPVENNLMVNSYSEQNSAETNDQSSELPKTSKERFFIVKSLTVEDLELSVRNGVWATQSHNEGTLNLAYENTENVFLIFSANKSGEYFGYARMSSAISDEVSSKIEWAPMAQSLDDPDLPKAIFTPATETAPKGRIIDDSSRGTIFWEAIDESNSDDDSESDATGERTTISKSWGKPFRVEWISTVKVPFYRTRGLRNPYNVSREVKIARDGTELEPSIGRRLLQMFHRGVGSPPVYGNIVVDGQGIIDGAHPVDGVHSADTTPPMDEVSEPSLIDDAASLQKRLEIPTDLRESVQA